MAYGDPNTFQQFSGARSYNNLDEVRQRRQQEQQQQQQGPGPLQAYQQYQQYAGGSASGATSGASGGATATGTTSGASGAGGSAAGGSSSGAGASGLMANPYAWLAAALAYKAYDTKKEGGISYEDQARDPSRAPKSDFDRWGLEKYTPFGGGEVYKGTFDLATGDVDDWAKSFEAPIKSIKDLF